MHIKTGFPEAIKDKIYSLIRRKPAPGPMIGQITPGSPAGKLIHDLAARPDALKIVEIGTGSGLGTTRCILDAMKESAIPEKRFWSMELNPEYHKIATANLAGYKDVVNFELICGRIIEYEDIFWFDHRKIDFKKDEHARLFYHQEMKLLKTSANVMSRLPPAIDLLVLDGGEYTTYPEWLRLKSAVKIVFLDDTRMLKSRRIRKELLADQDYTCLIDRPEERNGYSAFAKL